jgi:nucleotide-binding universal stress UspA family protein
MTIKHILLPLTGESNSADAAVCGLNVAKQLGAHVTAGYEDELGPMYFNAGMPGSVYNYATFYEPLQKARQERKATARQYFDRAVALTQLPIVSGPTCKQASTMWIDDRGGEDDPVSKLGALTDLVVLDAPGDRTSPVSWNVLEETLFNARRLALVVPTGTKSVDFSKPLIAWNGSAEAARAVECAIDLFPSDAKVTVLQVGALKPGRMPAKLLVEYLGWHCFETELRQVADKANATCQIILDAARDAGAGCIVMGAYTHSRTRQLLLGGVTDYMLRNPSLPMLLAH